VLPWLAQDLRAASLQVGSPLASLGVRRIALALAATGALVGCAAEGAAADGAAVTSDGAAVTSDGAAVGVTIASAAGAAGEQATPHPNRRAAIRSMSPGYTVARFERRRAFLGSLPRGTSARSATETPEEWGSRPERGTKF
jgi:hypothetical protein